MTKVVYKKLKTARSGKSAASAVGKKRVASSGGWKTVRTLDANDDNFDEGLTYTASRSQ